MCVFIYLREMPIEAQLPVVNRQHIDSALTRDWCVRHKAWYGKYWCKLCHWCLFDDV